jgi:hypothetical protein
MAPSLFGLADKGVHVAGSPHQAVLSILHDLHLGQEMRRVQGGSTGRGKPGLGSLSAWISGFWLRRGGAEDLVRGVAACLPQRFAIPVSNDLARHPIPDVDLDLQRQRAH